MLRAGSGDTAVPLRIEHLSPHILTQLFFPKNWFKYAQGLKLGGPWKEAPFDFLIARSHTIPNLLSGTAGAHI